MFEDKSHPRLAESARAQDVAGEASSTAFSRITELWQPGSLFHNFSRYPERVDVPRVDRLALVLEQELVAPSTSKDGAVTQNISIMVHGSSVAYDSLVFVHRLNEHSGLYLNSRPGHFTVLLEPSLAVLAPEDMGPNWPVMCDDEVYVRNPIEPHHFRGLVIHPAGAAEVLSTFLPKLEARALPVCTLDGAVLWPFPGVTS